MKYGESAFIVFYLIAVLTAGLLIRKRARNRNERRMGLAALILGFGTHSIWFQGCLTRFQAGIILPRSG